MTDIIALLGDEAESLLSHQCEGIQRDTLLNVIQDVYLSKDITIA